MMLHIHERRAAMKIAIFSDTYLPEVNGVAKTIGRLCSYLEKNNIEYRIFVPRYKGTKNEETVIRLPALNLPAYPESKISLPDYPHISKELDSFRPELIHVTTPFSIGLCGLKYAKSRKIPLVSSYHTNYSQYLGYFKLKFLEEASWNYLKWFHSQCQKNYCPSRNTMNMLKIRGIQNLEIWSRGINTKAFSPAFRNDILRKNLGIADKLVFLYAGRISPEKDIDILPEVIRRLSLKYSDHIHFLFAGDGPYLGTMKELSLPNTTFLGFVQGQELSRLYASSDIFIFPSSTETFGNVILEAMASGLPVIGCNDGGVSDNLFGGFNGMVCKLRNEDDFYNACVKLAEDREYARRLSRNALMHTLDMSWDKIFEKLINSYAQIINEASEQNNDMLKIKIA